MRWNLVRCRVGGWLALAVCLSVLVGCNNKKPVKPTTAPNKEEGKSDSVAPTSTAKQAANELFKQLADGTVKASQLTANFKKNLTKGFTDEDKRAGYSEGDVHSFLRGFEKATFEDVKEEKLGTAFGFRGRLKTQTDVKAFALRLVKSGNGYEIDWLHKSDRQCSLPEVPSDGELALAYDSARNFVDTLLGGDLTQTHALMDATWRKDLAPPFEPDLKRGLSFDPGYLTTRMRPWKGDFIGYSLTQPQLLPNKEEATFIAQMEALGTKVPYLVKASKNKNTSEWVITAFAKQ